MDCHRHSGNKITIDIKKFSHTHAHHMRTLGIHGSTTVYSMGGGTKDSITINGKITITQYSL